MTKQKNTAGDIDANAPEGLSLTPAEQVEARGEGAKDAVKEAAKDSYMSLTDGVNPGAAPSQQWHGSDEIQLYADNLSLGVEAFEELIADKNKLPEEKVYGLLALERNGLNRTPYVKAAMKRLGLKADELPGGGPDYTNDVTNVTKL